MSNRFVIFWYSVLFIYYINFTSSIICWLFSGDIYLSFGISLLRSVFSALAVFKIFCDEAFVILSAILLPIKSQADSAVFRIILFEAVFIESVVDLLALPRRF